MIARLKLPIMFLAFIGMSPASKDCQTGCHTVIVVTDCDGAVVPNAKVEAKLCCGENREINATTNSSGEAFLNSCLDDICSTRILLQGFKEFSLDRGGCSGEGKDSRCVVKMCAG